MSSPVCLDDTFGNDCSLTCDDCSNGGKCNQWKTGCNCPDGWIGLICNQSETHTHARTHARMSVIFNRDGTFCFSISQHALRVFLVKTAPSLLNVKMVRAVTPSPGAAAVHQGSAESFARMVSCFFVHPCTQTLVF